MTSIIRESCILQDSRMMDVIVLIVCVTFVTTVTIITLASSPPTTGSNNTRCVVWAQRYMFFLSVHISYCLTSIISVISGMRRFRGGNDNIGPKQRVWRRLGPRCVFFINFYLPFYLLEPPGPVYTHQNPLSTPSTPFRPLFESPPPFSSHEHPFRPTSTPFPLTRTRLDPSPPLFRPRARVSTPSHAFSTHQHPSQATTTPFRPPATRLATPIPLLDTQPRVSPHQHPFWTFSHASRHTNTRFGHPATRFDTPAPILDTQPASHPTSHAFRQPQPPYISTPSNDDNGCPASVVVN